MRLGTIGLLSILAVSEVLSLLCAGRLWRSAQPLRMRLLWTLVLVIPILGPVFFGALFPPTRPGRDVADNPAFDLTRFDPSNGNPPER
ncbi:MAG TPA: hypothetical protein VII72_21630 [Myxococcota bacterium]